MAFRLHAAKRKPGLKPFKESVIRFSVRLLVAVTALAYAPATTHAVRLMDEGKKSVESGAPVTAAPSQTTDETNPMTNGKQQEQPNPKRITINFDEADIRTVIKFISELTGKNFLIDDRVKGAVTILSPSAITVDEAYRVFLSALELKGFTVVEAGKIFKVLPSKEARQRDIQTVKGEKLEGVGREDRIITQIVPLSFANANDLKGMLSPMVSKDSDVTAYTPTNTLFITDYASNIHRLLGIIRDIDVEGTDEKISMITLKYASAKTLVTELMNLVEEKGQQATAAHRTVRRTKNEQPETAVETGTLQVTKLLADERTNSIIIVASLQETKKIKDLISKLDQPLPPGLGRIHVVYLENARAEDLVQVLTQLPTKASSGSTQGETATQAGPKAPLLGEDVQIIADKPTNSLIIFASSQDFDTLKTVIDKLDIMRAQVLVEGLIAEVSLDTGKDLGVQWRYLSQQQAGNTRSYGGFNEPQTNALSFGSADGLPSDLGSVLSLGGLALGVFQGPISIAGKEFINMNAVVRAFQSNSDVNILSTPHILTMDNEEAEIIVAENRPFLKSQTGTASSTTNEGETVSTGVVQNFEFKDVGITLRITPQISKGQFVRLAIFQEVSNVIGEVEQAAGAFITSKRQATTTVVVEDKQTVVIGGLIQDRQGASGTGVPCLAQIPGFGNLFRTQSREGAKRNLLIFITPNIINTPQDLTTITKRKHLENEQSVEDYRQWKKRDLRETLDMLKK